MRSKIKEFLRKMKEFLMKRRRMFQGRKETKEKVRTEIRVYLKRRIQILIRALKIFLATRLYEYLNENLNSSEENSEIETQPLQE